MALDSVPVQLLTSLSEPGQETFPIWPSSCSSLTQEESSLPPMVVQVSVPNTKYVGYRRSSLNESYLSVTLCRALRTERRKVLRAQ